MEKVRKEKDQAMHLAEHAKNDLILATADFNKCQRKFYTEELAGIFNELQTMEAERAQQVMPNNKISTIKI